MKSAVSAVFVIFCLALAGPQVFAQGTNDPKAELQDLVQKVNAKLTQKKKTEAELAPELKEFDTLLARHKNEKTDDVGQILLMKAMLYVKVFGDTKKGLPMLEMVQQDFPNTEPAKKAERIIETVKSQEQAEEIQRSLADGTKFPDFSVTDLSGKQLSIANYKGKVVLLDFWATWCTPCVQELPNVIKAYKQYHPQGFEVIGISLDQQKGKLTTFLRDKDMTWPQYFDGKGWQNDLAVKYGIRSIPATFLLDGEGKIIGKDLRGEALSQAVAKALPRK